MKRYTLYGLSVMKMETKKLKKYSMKTKKYWFVSQVFYRSCLNSDQQPHRNGAKKIEEIIRKVGGWNLTKTDGRVFLLKIF